VISLRANIEGALSGSEALVVMTPCPEFQSIDPELAPPVVFDASGFLDKALRARTDIQYYSIGRAN
jgi:hypothetical protein